jgi:hypothetical protein
MMLCSQRPAARSGALMPKDDSSTVRTDQALRGLSGFRLTHRPTDPRDRRCPCGRSRSFQESDQNRNRGIGYGIWLPASVSIAAEEETLRLTRFDVGVVVDRGKGFRSWVVDWITRQKFLAAPFPVRNELQDSAMTERFRHVRFRHGR